MKYSSIISYKYKLKIRCLSIKNNLHKSQELLRSHIFIWMEVKIDIILYIFVTATIKDFGKRPNHCWKYYKKKEET